MQFEHTATVQTLIRRLEAFFDEHIYPNETAVDNFVAAREGAARWEPVPLLEELKPKARAAGLWNLFLPHSERGAGLTNLESDRAAFITACATSASPSARWK